MAPQAPVEWSPHQARIALVIGHNHGSGSRPPLRFAERDAARVAEVLRELGGFAPHDVHLLSAPRLGEVEHALARVKGKLARLGDSSESRHGFLTLYFSGHSDGHGLELGSESLSFAELKAWFAEVGAELRVMILDACQSGSLLALKGGTRGRGLEFFADAPAVFGEAVLTSAAPDEVALESSQLQGSFFSHHLVSALRGAADLDGDRRVTLAEAFDYASSRTVEETSATLFGAQHPNYYLKLSGERDLVLTQIPTTRAQLEIGHEWDRLQIVDARRGAVLLDLPRVRDRRLALVPGPYVVKAWKGIQIEVARIKLGLGETRRLEPADFEPLEKEEAGEAQAAPPAPAVSSAPAVTESRHLSGNCRYQCVIQGPPGRNNCGGPVRSIEYEPSRSTWQLTLPDREASLELRFEVCNPEGFWLHLADSPSANGGGGDATDFAHDAEIEFRDLGLWVFPSDYGRAADGTLAPLGAVAGYAARSGCSERTLRVGDRVIHSDSPNLVVDADVSLRLDPPRDDEGRPDRVWFLGVNRSVGSRAPERVGAGLSWIELCIR